MQDVSSIVFSIVFLAALTLDFFAPPSRKIKLLSIFLMLLGFFTIFKKIYLPIDADIVNALAWLCGAGWLILFVVGLPRAARAIKAAARE